MSKILLSLLGHVDVGKTSILNFFTKSKEKEVGNITQQIRTYSFDSNELELITENQKFRENFIHDGIILIDTPGHEYFVTMRKVTSYTSHFVILVVNIITGLEKTHKEIIKFLKANSIDFIIVLNKIDLISEWIATQNATLKLTFKAQKKSTLTLLNNYILNLICQFAELEVNAQVYYSNSDYKTYVSMVPISAKTGEGVSDLLFLLSKLYTKKEKILNDKNIPRDLIYVLDRQLDQRFGQYTLCVKSGKTSSNKNFCYVLNSDNTYRETKIKIINNKKLEDNGIFYITTLDDLSLTDIIYHQKMDLKFNDLALSNSTLIATDEYDYDEDNTTEDKELLVKDNYNYKSTGICIVSESRSMEGALNKIFSDVPIAIFSDKKLDKAMIIRASNMMKFKKSIDEEFNQHLKVIAIFDPKYNESNTEYISKEVKSLCTSNYINILVSNTIYKLKDEYDKLKNKHFDFLKTKYASLLDCKLEIIPEFIFLKSSPLLFGVIVKEGELNLKTKIYTTFNGNESILGEVTSIKLDTKQIEKATKNMKVCIKIEPIDKKVKFDLNLDANSILKTYRTKDEDQTYNRLKLFNAVKN
jgi:translation initiation factor 5B